MLVSAIGKFNTFSKNYAKSNNTFGTVYPVQDKKCPKPAVKSDSKVTYKR